MKGVVVVLLMLLLCVAAASAAQDSWRITIKGDIGPQATAAASVSLGVYPTALDGLDPQDGSDYRADVVDESMVALAAVVPGQPTIYTKSIKAPTMSNPEKVWDFYVAGKTTCTGDVLRLRAFTASSATLPTATFDGVSVRYYIRMLDNKGISGAPDNGTIWRLPTPTTYSATTAYWTIPTDLPIIKLSFTSNSALIAEGYKLQLVQAVPEPGSLMAFGGGLLGLAGMIRRRRA